MLSMFMLLGSCNNPREQSYDINSSVDTTALFAEYLQKILIPAIPESSHCYYIISNQGCNECIKELVSYTKEIFHQLDTTQNTFINAKSSIESIFSSEMKSVFKVDSFGEISNYALGITNVSLVFTHHQKVDSIVPLKWGDEVKIPSLLKMK
ncbi:MAG: hypothetical protein Fur0028_05720 [Bacteroidales bacterium]